MERFRTEPHRYEKGAWSDLQGAWGSLRQTVVEAGPFPDATRLLFHIDEGMSWESVREPKAMRQALLLVHNVAVQGLVPPEVIEDIQIVREAFDDVQDAIERGDAR